MNSHTMSQCLTQVRMFVFGDPYGLVIFQLRNRAQTVSLSSADPSFDSEGYEVDPDDEDNYLKELDWLSIVSECADVDFFALQTQVLSLVELCCTLQVFGTVKMPFKIPPGMASVLGDGTRYSRIAHDATMNILVEEDEVCEVCEYRPWGWLIHSLQEKLQVLRRALHLAEPHSGASARLSHAAIQMPVSELVHALEVARYTTVWVCHSGGRMPAKVFNERILPWVLFDSEMDVDIAFETVASHDGRHVRTVNVELADDPERLAEFGLDGLAGVWVRVFPTFGGTRSGVEEGSYTLSMRGSPVGVPWLLKSYFGTSLRKLLSAGVKRDVVYKTCKYVANAQARVGAIKRAAMIPVHNETTRVEVSKVLTRQPGDLNVLEMLYRSLLPSWRESLRSAVLDPAHHTETLPLTVLSDHSVNLLSVKRDVLKASGFLSRRLALRSSSLLRVIDEWAVKVLANMMGVAVDQSARKLVCETVGDPRCVFATQSEGAVLGTPFRVFDFTHRGPEEEALMELVRELPLRPDDARGKVVMSDAVRGALTESVKRHETRIKWSPDSDAVFRGVSDGGLCDALSLTHTHSILQHLEMWLGVTFLWS